MSTYFTLHSALELVGMVDVLARQFVDVAQLADDRLEAGSDIGLVKGADRLDHRQLRAGTL